MKSTIIGATTMEQLKRNIDSNRITLDKYILDGIKAIHARYSTPAP